MAYVSAPTGDAAALANRADSVVREYATLVQGAELDQLDL